MKKNGGANSDLPKLRYFLVEPFVLGVKGGDRDVDYTHFADGTMAAAGLYEDSGKRFYRLHFAIQLHVPFAFEDKVNLREFFMVMDLCILLDIDYVHRGKLIFGADKGPS